MRVTVYRKKTGEVLTSCDLNDVLYITHEFSNYIRIIRKSEKNEKYNSTTYDTTLCRICIG